jgi:hypothetical protein
VGAANLGGEDQEGRREARVGPVERWPRLAGPLRRGGEGRGEAGWWARREGGARRAAANLGGEEREAGRGQ